LLQHQEEEEDDEDENEADEDLLGERADEIEPMPRFFNKNFD
jgi:hypothetical protein